MTEREKLLGDCLIRWVLEYEKTKKELERLKGSMNACGWEDKGAQLVKPPINKDTEYLDELLILVRDVINTSGVGDLSYSAQIILQDYVERINKERNKDD